jgi:hypothetical protein
VPLAALVPLGASVGAPQEPRRDAHLAPHQRLLVAFLLALRAQHPDQQALEDASVAAEQQIPAPQALQFQVPFQAWARLLAQADAQHRAPQVADRLASREGQPQAEQR